MTRQRVITELTQRATPASAAELAGALGVSVATVNRALTALLATKAVTFEQAGRARVWTAAAPTGASPYSTGGGGVRLEHRYVACLLSAFIAGESVAELGDSVDLDCIRLQASDISDVDDIVLEGRDGNGVTHRASVAARRSPSLTPKDVASVPLIRDYLRVVLQHWHEVEAGTWKLVLAVSSPAKAVSELAELTTLAASVPSGSHLRERFTQPGRTSSALRKRFDALVALTASAAADLAVPFGVGHDELTWRLLAHLRVRSLRLERGDHTDRTVAINALSRALRAQTPQVANSLFARLDELAGEWAAEGAVLTQGIIRRRLGEFPLTRLPRFEAAWDVLDRLEERYLDTARPFLRMGSQQLELPRDDERTKLREAMVSASSRASGLIVTGEPDIGKSALTRRAAEALRNEGMFIVMLSLRDLPADPLELEQALGNRSLESVLQASGTGQTRLLVVDGAESAQEGKGPILTALGVAAMKAGYGVVAVTRRDGAQRVEQALEEATVAAELDEAPATLQMHPLTQTEQTLITGAFPALGRLGLDPRSQWLLSRPGLLDALLRTGAVLEPGEVLCESDVFRVVWNRAIRKSEERHAGMASADDRERAALAVARRDLGLPSEAVVGYSASELRADGVLRTPDVIAFSAGDQFATDLYRDLAVCRLIILEQWAPLARADAPRWSVRAARLACQVALSTADVAAAWSSLTRTFGSLAGIHGPRWAELPYEALLALGDAERLLQQLWGVLVSDGEAIVTLLRVAESRYISSGIGDVFALRALVNVTLCQGHTVPLHGRVRGRSLPVVVRDVVLAWMRGAAIQQFEPDEVRRAVRDVVLSGDAAFHDSFAAEVLGLLGPDLDERASQWLRAAGDEDPHYLGTVVESAAVAISMARVDPMLLLDLAETYYIETPDSQEAFLHAHHLGEGIRDLKHGVGSAYYSGPFHQLLMHHLPETVAFINRMLDHAALVRTGGGLRTRRWSRGDADAPLALDFPGVGERTLVGDEQVWAWYRGTTVGSPPCTSALLAVERVIDELHLLHNVSADRIVRMLLSTCNNLAMAGLVMGFLVRHPESSGELLDPFLASPEVWEFETARLVREGGFHTRGTQGDHPSGSERRRLSLHEVVGGMVLDARADRDRLDALARLGNQLSAQARRNGHLGDHLAIIDSWAAEFRVENYGFVREGEQYFVQFRRPAQLEAALADGNAHIAVMSELYGLQHRYATFNERPELWPLDTLSVDLAAAQRIDDATQSPDAEVWPSTTSVAAAAVRAHALGLVPIAGENLAWAIEKVIRASGSVRADGLSYEDSIFPMGDDRAAAVAVPLLWMPAFVGTTVETVRAAQALHAASSSYFSEVRACFALGAQPVWTEPCAGSTDEQGCSRHGPIWKAALSGLADSLIGDLDEQTWVRKSTPLPAPYHDTLPTAAADALIPGRLRPVLACMVDARSAPCLSKPTADLWEPLWDAHRGAVLHHWEQGWDHLEIDREGPIARRYLRLAVEGDVAPLRQLVVKAAQNATALHILFESLATVFTYDAELRQNMNPLWPMAMRCALDVIGDGEGLRTGRGSWFGYAAAALIPVPTMRALWGDEEETLRIARSTWLDPRSLGELGDRWLKLSKQEPHAVEAVLELSLTSAPAWATTIALDWIEKLMDDRPDLLANRLSSLGRWRAYVWNGPSSPEGRRRVLRIIDALASSGDREAVQLQKLEE